MLMVSWSIEENKSAFCCGEAKQTPGDENQVLRFLHRHFLDTLFPESKAYYCNAVSRLEGGKAIYE
jgi:hypothetical protein